MISNSNYTYKKISGFVIILSILIVKHPSNHKLRINTLDVDIYLRYFYNE
jgi:hypothetical protein